MTTLQMNAQGSRHATYFQQARMWYRYARCLEGCPYDVYLKKEEALMHSLHLRGRSFVLPARLSLTADAEPGLYRLKRRHDTESYRFLELAARVVQTDDDDPAKDEIHLLLEEPDRTTSRNRKYFLGRLPQEDAFWLTPLLRLETDAYGTGPVIRFFVERAQIRIGTRGHVSAETSDVRVVIAHAHEAARQWLDWKDERRERFETLYRSTYYEERSYGDGPYSDLECAEVEV